MRIGKVKIELPFIACMAAILYLDHTRFMFYLLGLAAIHEIGHILMMKCCGERVKELIFSGFRIQITLSEKHFLSYKQEVVIALAGPLFNFLVALLCYLLLLLGVKWNDAPFIILASLAIGVLNLFPIEPLDGSRITKNLLFWLFPFDLAEHLYTAVKAVGLVTLFFLAGSMFLFTGYNVSLMTVCLFLGVRMLIGEKGSFWDKRKKEPTLKASK